MTMAKAVQPAENNRLSSANKMPSPMIPSERNFARPSRLVSLQSCVAACERGGSGRTAAREFLRSQAPPCQHGCLASIFARSARPVYARRYRFHSAAGLQTGRLARDFSSLPVAARTPLRPLQHAPQAPGRPAG